MNDWELAQELFELTAGLSTAERERVLHERSGEHPDLAERVQALVKADATPHAGFAIGATELLLKLQDEPAPELLCGLEFDAYHIDSYLASGGMAHVYQATRSSAGTTRRVALKVLRPSLDTEAFLKHFQRERETLAALEHEHIISFLDAGTLPDGRPYLVMEYMTGTPLCAWKPGAPVEQKLALFQHILSAVQHAHERLVVHRDLKPSNVLVTPQGIPKLLDFGVASALNSDLGDAQARTPLTPVYASPEVLAGELATTRSDVYSLGVLLLEFLTGSTDEASATPRLKADLQAILAKARAADPLQRYRSPEDLGRDLQRHLQGEPVTARRGSWFYHAKLYLRRQRFALLFAGSVIVALVAGWVGSDLERRLAQKDASIGWGAHAQARAASSIFERWILAQGLGNPALSTSAEAHFEQALTSGLDEYPESQTLVRIALGQLYLERGALKMAGEQLELARTLADSTRGVGHSDRERIRDLLKRLAQLSVPQASRES